MRVAIIANPVSGRGRPLRRLSQFLATSPRLPFEVELKVTRAPGDAGHIAESLVANPPDLVAVCGGDGTVNEVLAAVQRLPCPLGLLPGGTANVLAKELGIPLDPVEALRGFAASKTITVDTGLLHCEERRPFLLMAGVGLDAHIAGAVSPTLKRCVGIAAYYPAVAAAIRTYGFPEFEVTADGVSLPARSCLVANVRNYGGDLRLTPAADFADGEFDLLVLGRASRSAYLWLIVNARVGRVLSAPWIERRRCRRVGIAGPGEVTLHVDGEVAGRLPASVEVRPASLRLAVQ